MSLVLGNLHVGDRVLVRFYVAAVAVDPEAADRLRISSMATPGEGGIFRDVWKERRVLGVEIPTRMVRVLGYHLEPIDVPFDWLREVPAAATAVWPA